MERDRTTQGIGLAPDDVAARRAAALAEHAVAGRQLLLATTLAEPTGTRGMAVAGDADLAAAACVALVDRGWLVVADRPSPTDWSAVPPVALPDPSPFLVGPLAAAGRASTPVRAGSTAHALDVPRLASAVPLAAVLVVGAARPGQPAVTPVHGHHRLPRVAALPVGGVLSPQGLRSAEADLSGLHARIAALPMLLLRSRSPGDAIAEVLAWWDTQ